MAITLIGGQIRSGKTYLAVTRIAEKFLKSEDFEKSEYRCCYTNINNFQFDKFEGDVRHLNFDKLDFCALWMNELLKKNKELNNIDEPLNELFDDIAEGKTLEEIETPFTIPDFLFHRYDEIKGFRFNRTMIVIDEAADFLHTKQAHLVKWLSYSGHIYQDIYLLQNELGNLNTAYRSRAISNRFYQAADSSDRLKSNLMRYGVYSHPKFHQNSKVDVLNVKFDPEIFALYGSGKVEIRKPRIHKYLAFFAVVLGFLIFMIYWVFTRDVATVEDAEPQKKELTQSNGTAPKPQSKRQHKEPKTKVTFDEVCFYCVNGACTYNAHIFSSKKVDYLLKKYKMTFIYSEPLGIGVFRCFESKNGFSDLYKVKSPTAEDTKSALSNPQKFDFSLFGGGGK
jgi:hypothetical protein